MDSVAKKKHDDIVAKAKKAAPFKAGKYILRCKPNHPRKKYYVLDLEVSNVFAEYDVSEAQAKELSSVGARAWVEHGDEKKMVADKKLHKIDLKALDKEQI